MVTATVGDVLRVTGGIDIDAYAPQAQGGNSSFADASNTARLTITPITPGAGFSADSGATYSVPEPTGLAVSACVSVLALSRRRQLTARRDDAI